MAGGERGDRGRGVVAWLVAGVVVVGGAVGVGSVVADDGPSAASSGGPSSSPSEESTDAVGPAGDDAAAWSPAPWEGARLDGDRLALYFTSSGSGEPGDPCSREYETVVEPSEDTMVVTLRGRSPAPASLDQCPDVGYDRSVTVELPEPLQGRTMVDGASGEARAISRAARLLTPSWLPAGYEMSSGDVDSDTDSYVDRRVWARKGPPDKQLIVEQGGETVDELGTPGHEPVVLERPTIRGRPAAVWKSEGFDDLVCVSWIEDATGHRVCSSGPPGDLLPTDKLIRVADQLRARGSS